MIILDAYAVLALLKGDPVPGRYASSSRTSRLARVSRYDTSPVETYASARKHGIADEDITHAVERWVAAGEQDDGRVLYLGPDQAANLLEVVSVVRDDGTQIVMRAMRMRAKYEPFLRSQGDDDA